MMSNTSGAPPLIKSMTPFIFRRSVDPDRGDHPSKSRGGRKVGSKSITRNLVHRTDHLVGEKKKLDSKSKMSQITRDGDDLCPRTCAAAAQ